MREITATGRTVETAVKSALAQLKTTKNQAEIIVVDEGKKGFLGLGARQATVVVKLIKQPVDYAKEFLEEVCNKMGVSIVIDIKQNGRNLLFTLSGEKIALLIGKRGQTLNSLQYLTQLAVNKQANEFYKVQLDAEGYRERRKQALILLAERTAHQAVRLGKEIPLEPMPSNERKIIHTALVHHKEVKTYSHGEDANRHIIIAPSANKSTSRKK